MFAVLGHMINAMMAGNTARGLSHADLVIRPAVDAVSSMEFHNTVEIAALGYQAAEANSAELLKYAVDEPTYAAFRAERDARRRRVELIPRSVEVTGVPEVTQATIRARMESHLNVPLDVVRLARDITRLGGSDRFETIGYRVVSGPDGPVLKLTVQPKPYGPPFLALGVEVTNTSGTNLQLALGSRLTAYDVLGYRSEARMDLRLGSGLEVRGELYRPVGRSPWFVAASAGILQHESPAFAGRETVADYRLTRSGAGVDIGYNTGYRSEVRFGYQVANLQASVRVGNPVLPELEGGERLLRLQGIFDDQDSPMIPSRGIYARGRVSHILDAATVIATAPDVTTFTQDPNFTTAEVAVNWFKMLGSRWRLLASADGGTAFGSTPLPPNDFPLGGPFRFGAYNVGEIRTSDFLIGSGGVLREFGRLPEVLGGGVFGGAWLETGSAFDGEGLRANLSTGLVIETLLGPLFAGGSVGFDGRTRIYVGMGPLFQRGVR
jgi:NTE family protein